MKTSKWITTLLAIAIWPTEPNALVGASQSGDALAPYIVMVLKRTKSASGFCSGVAIARDVILTAAHCVSGAADLRILPGAGGQADLMEIGAVQTHPEFRPNAPKTRERSIDLALVRTKVPLPSRFTIAQLDRGSPITLGQRLRIGGFGIATEGDERSAGRLREGELEVRAPLSKILLWTQDPNGRGFGACTGDSGGPMFAADANIVVGITAWATGAGKRNCGALTQATLVAPQAKWIDSILASWGTR